MVRTLSIYLCGDLVVIRNRTVAGGAKRLDLSVCHAPF